MLCGNDDGFSWCQAENSEEIFSGHDPKDEEI